MTLRYINLLLYDIDQYTSNNIASYTFYANIMLSKFECWLIRIYLPVTLNRNILNHFNHCFICIYWQLLHSLTKQ